MRLIRSKIYRAFPELDRFGDEQCERFVAAANASWVRLLGRWIVVGGASAAMLVLTLGASLFVCAALEPNRFLDDWQFFLVGSVVCVIGSAFGLVPGLIVRDVILRRRVRSLLARCGACPDCRYSLLGMRVGPELVVICPECGRRVKTDPALGELATDETGASVYRPQIVREDDESRQRRRRRHRRFLRWTGGAIGTVVALLVIAYGVWWLTLVQQARRARAERNTRVQVEALQRGMWKGAAGPESREEWCRLMDIVQRISRHTRTPEGDARYKSDDGTPAYFDYTVLLPETTETEWDGRRGGGGPGAYRACRRLTLDALAGMREDGSVREARALLELRAPMRELVGDWEKPFFGVVIDGLGECRGLARACAARMVLALERGDRDEYVEALEEGLAAGRFVARQGLLIDALVGYAIQSLMAARVEEELARYPDEAWTRGVLDAMLRQRDLPPLAENLEMEWAGALDALQYFFADPARVQKGQLGLLGPDVYGMGWNGTGSLIKPGSLGTYSGNRRALDGFYDGYIAYLRRPPQARGVMPGGRTGYPLVDMVAPSMSASLAAETREIYTYRHCVYALGVRLHRQQSGGEPETVWDVLQFLPDPALAIDPYSSKPFRYERVSDGKGKNRLVVLGGDEDEPNVPKPPPKPGNGAGK